MPKFYFHLSNCDECFPDDIGHDFPDIAAAHTRAKRLAKLVMATSRLSSHPPDWRRWTVTVTDDSQGAISDHPVRRLRDRHSSSIVRVRSNRSRRRVGDASEHARAIRPKVC